MYINMSFGYVCQYCCKEYKSKKGLNGHIIKNKECKIIRELKSQLDSCQLLIDSYQFREEALDIENNDLKKMLKKKDVRIEILDQKLYNKNKEIDQLKKEIDLISNEKLAINNIHQVTNNQINVNNNIVIVCDGKKSFSQECFDPSNFTLNDIKNGPKGLADYASRSMLINEENNIHNYICLDETRKNFQYLQESSDENPDNTNIIPSNIEEGNDTSSIADWLPDQDAKLLCKTINTALKSRVKQLLSDLNCNMLINRNTATDNYFEIINNCTKIRDCDPQFMNDFINEIKERVHVNPDMLTAIQFENRKRFKQMYPNIIPSKLINEMDESSEESEEYTIHRMNNSDKIAKSIIRNSGFDINELNLQKIDPLMSKEERLKIEANNITNIERAFSQNGY